MTSPHLPPGDDPRRHREFRPDDAYADPRMTGEMNFLEHLDELRSVLQHVVAGVAVGALGGWWLAPRVLSDLIARTVKTTVVMSPFEAFNERLKLAALIGLMISLPYVLWRIWSFILPGLLRQERRWVVPLSLASCLLFATGAWAAYAYVVPLVIHVLEQFLTPGMVSQMRLSLLLDFFYNMALACGVLMQLPLVTMLLTAIGLVTPMFLLQQWRAAIVVIFVVTAAITPGDVVSAQVVMGGPMALLYFVSVGLSFFVAKRKSRAEALEGWSDTDTGENSNA
ncbi:MAG: twin-arginine translocase subunit TatC [Candidatus Eisenbacteria bacterium]